MKSNIRHQLINKGLVRPASFNRSVQQPGHAIAVRRIDDRPATRVIPVTYKRSINAA